MNSPLQTMIQQETELFFLRLESLELTLKAKGTEPHFEMYKEAKKELLLEMLEEFSDQLKRIDLLIELQKVNGI